MKRRGYPMKHSKIIGIIAFAVILSLLGVTIPATPALAQPTVTLSPTSGSIDTTVTITATNFESFKNTEVSIFLNGVEIDNSPVLVPDDGSFTAYFDVPEDATPGTAQVVVKTILGGEVSVSFTILEAEVELHPEEGHVGTMVTIDGSGFYAEKRVTFYYDGTKTELGSKNASAIGECSLGFAVPESTAGDHLVVAQDTEGSWAEANFIVIPSITIEPTSGAIGDEVTISGTGFGNQSEVTIYLDDEQVATSKTDRFGNLEVTFAASITETGTYEVEVKDKDGNRDKAEITLTAGFKLSTTMGNVGTPLTINGTGFIAGGTVTIKYDDMEVATTTANATGAFSLTLKAPASTGGTHSITISDSDNTVKNIFTMESTPPPTPAPLIPEDVAKTKAEAYFDWEEVTDDSGVTYTLQIATGKNFSSIVLEKEELTYSDYEITGVEALPPTKKEAPYYWRVKAVDGASNESEWSTPKSFYVSSTPALPDWAKYTLIVFGILAVCFLAFWVGRRTAYYRQ
jgi:hypothetical protein